jgi:hypothetical protein
MKDISLTDEQRAALLEAQLASLRNGDELLAGTDCPTEEYGWWALDGIVVRDDSGKEQEILRQLLPDGGQATTEEKARPAYETD